MKRFIICTMFLVLVCSLSGCGKKSENNAVKDKKTEEKKGSVFFLNNRKDLESRYKEIAKEYEKKTGVKVKVRTVDEEFYEENPSKKLTGTDTPSLLSIHGVRNFVRWEDYCEDISDSEIYDYLEDKTMAISDSQGVYAVPAAVEGYGIVYNEELMERYIELDTKGTAIQSAEQIRDLDTFEDVVKDMEAHKKDLGIDGVFASPSLEKENRRPWIKYLAGAVLAEEFADNPDYDNEILSAMASSHIEFRDSDCYKRLIDLYTKHGVKKNGLSRVTIEDSLQELAMGKCVMLQTGNWSWHYLSSVKGTVLNSEKLKMLPIYLGTKGDANRGICIGTEDYLAINKQASEKDKEASLEFLRWLYGSAEGKELVLNKLGFIAPFNTFSHKDVPNNPLAKEVVRYMEDEERKNVAWVFTAFPDDDFYEDVGEDLYKYISGKIDFPKFVQEFQKEWKEESVATASTKGYNKQE